MRKILVNGEEMQVTASLIELNESQLRVLEKELNRLHDSLTGKMIEDMESRDTIREIEKLLNPNQYSCGLGDGECLSCGS